MAYERMEHMAGMAGMTGARIGRSLAAWAADVRDFVRKHPVQLLAATIGVGYVLGKVMQR